MSSAVRVVVQKNTAKCGFKAAQDEIHKTLISNILCPHFSDVQEFIFPCRLLPTQSYSPTVIHHK